jgi:hypothetical protein
MHPFNGLNTNKEAVMHFSHINDRAAVNALSMCKFQPAMHGGAAEAGWAQLACVWTLE